MKKAGGPIHKGFVFGAGRGEVEDPATDKDADFRTFVKETDVTVGGTAFIMASVYGGSENGRVANDTHVTIKEDCQIGCGEGKVTDGKPVRYTTAQWTGEDASNFTECASWYFKSPYWPYDPYGGDDAGLEGTDGHTYYGNVFGGGSGYFPYKRADGTHDWLRSAGRVEGNTEVLITGGHILNCVYGGNELTDVTGKATVKMVGGTLGVPRTDSQMKNHPVTCYLFGGGKGDQRTHFNTWTNVGSTEVEVSGTARIFGSVFGGGEDGHILGNANVNIGGTVKIDLNGDRDTDDSGETFIAQSGLKIGTTGTSYVDGNVFGGGRGFSGLALTAGSVHGNIELTINGGTMLGSVYGGGRLASVGIDMVDATLADGSPNPAYGLLKDDTDSETCGRITVSITGGTIGNDVAGAEYGGNVFGGSMGRLTLLDGTTNPQWPKLAASKLTNVTISGGTIKRNVYGGSEYGIVRNRATVNVSGGTINGSVFGSGRGSEKTEKQTIAVAGYDNFYYTFTPMLWAGCVSGSTFVNISGGTVKKNVYGGGELASVGLIDFVSDASGNFTNMTKHESLTNGFGLSWPYEFHYHAAAPSDLPAVGGKEIGGKATVTIIGGKIGDASNAESGYVFGGGMGKPMERYTEAFMANVRETEVSIKYASTATALSDDNCITGAVYGGGENGHVYENSAVNITGGLIGYSVYGGGKGIDKYKATLKNWKDNGATTYETDIYSITAGKVYGNTSVTMSGGHVMRNVYGGGYMASVGKGNYAGGADDYSDFTSEKFGHMSGYGETITGNLWDGVSENSQAFLNSGKATVTITGGTVGTPVGTAEDEYGGLPTGNVIGGSKGEPAPNVFNMPVHEYNPTFHVGNINEAEVIIGDSTTTGVGPRIYASVYGGGQDGHMRRDSKVTIYGGEIGLSSSDISSKYANDGTPANTLQWEHRGNVYGSGSGIGKFEYDYNGNGTTGADQYYEFDSDGDGTAEKHYEVGMSYLAGCVARFSEVNILGGTIHRSVYGGGSVAGTGMPKFYGQNYEPYKKGDTAEGHGPGKQSQNTVTISGGTIGQVGYGGNVFGASRGEAELVAVENPMFATAIWTEVNIKGGTIAGNVYGGGELGSVKKDTKVSLTGGEIKNNAYGGGKGIKADEGAVEANIGGNTTVELNKGKAAGDNGCIVERIFGCNDQNGTPKGHALVHVYATQHKDETQIVPEGGKYAKFESMEGGYSITNYSGLTTLAAATGTDVSAYTAVLSGEGTEDEKKTALANMIEAIADEKYDVLAVYGGGDLAMYEPTDPNEATDVIIDGCALTSIKQVYGGGNAASTPANLVRINEAYEIHEVFGGGNGKDAYEKGGKWYENLGANVGYKATFHSDKSGDPTTGTKANPYPAVENDDANTPEERRANTSYHYGKGTIELNVTGGYVHTTYGGSNMKGNVRKSAVTNTEDAGVCTLQIDASYPAGKNADTDGEAKINGSCVDYLEAIYGGSENANVYSDVVIDITNGHYGAIYGGNNTRGKIYGSITINVHEEGCKPIIIDNLYGGGYNADYSIYGYNDDGSARTKTQYDALDASEKAKITVQRDPQINIISATRIGKIYGGGYNAKMIGSPSVNVNMEEGFVTAKYVTKDPDDFKEGDHHVIDHGVDCSYYVEKLEDGKAILRRGTVGSVYGGGYKGDVQGDTDVEIGTGEWLNFTGKRETTDAEGKVYTYNSETNKWDWTKTEGGTTTSGTVDDKPAPARNAATITENVYGGGEGEAKESGDRAFFCEAAMVGVDGDGLTNPAGGTSVVIANGTVGTLEAGKLVAGTGNVYGGGEIGRVEKNTVVTIGVTPKEGETMDNTKFKPTIYGNVFGAGKGVETHGYSALVRGNSTVTIQGFAKVGESVYGGGEISSVGRYNVGADGIPTSLVSDDYGNCFVIVKDDAEIGPDNMTMFHVDGSGNIVANDQPDNSGHVFGAGKGAMPGDYNTAKHMTNTNTMVTGFASEDLYLKFIESLGLATQTEVTIGGNAFVKGDVFGGAEQGFVQHNTHVVIEGNCQIGGGYVQMNADGGYLARTDRYSLNRRYTDEEWSAGKLTDVAGYENSLPECASWEYGQAEGADKYAPHDIYYGAAGYDSKGGRTIADNGSTFYGNVFGGGSGYFSYAPDKWHWKAGEVGGNTLVEIKGGHVLTNVYGGNEMTNVDGKCTINMSGGTIGVPRTLGQILAHPVTCYLFGGGKGDPRVLFNKQTNVNDVEVNISGGWIYGSAFGGGEDGHVMRNVTMNISGGTVETPTYADYYAGSATKIGTWGTSYVDGNVFGGGRGFAGDAYTAGNVAGSVNLTISGGTMLGSIYGGGRLGSVGYGLYDAGVEGYGKIRDDDKMDDGTDGTSFFTKGRGHVEINISGGTIGNNREDIIPNATNIAAAGIAETDISKWKPESEDGSEWTTWKTYHHVPSTTYDTSDGKLHHTRGGNVYAGGMGRRENLNGQVISMAREGINWLKLGNVKSTKLTITGGTIKSNVYGGGEYGAVQGNHKVLDGEGNPIVVNEKNVVAGTEIIITGGTIGSEILGNSASDVKYTYGSVFGGGTGTTDDVAMTDSVIKADTLGAYVADSTRITLTNAIVKASVFGGGELSAVGGNTNVNISGTTEIGRNEVRPKSDPNPGYVMFGGWRMGNVYGGGRGSEKAAIAGLVKGNTNVRIEGGNIYHNVYGGGALASVGEFKISNGAIGLPPAGVPYWPTGPGIADDGKGVATVTITGGTIGISGRDNGMVFGSSRGDLSAPVDGMDPYNKVAWVKRTNVTIGTEGGNRTTPLVRGSVYGGGENGHNYQNATVNVLSGTIGIPDKNPATGADEEWWDFGNDALNAEYRAYRGNVYGAGSGSDTYTKDGKEYHNPRAGMVGGSTVVNIKGGHIGRSVYGAGAMASLGNIINARDTLDVSRGGTGNAKHLSETNGFALSWPYLFNFVPQTGKATVNVTGGHIGTLNVDGGDVYGSARGEAGDRYEMAHFAYANTTEVNINYDSTPELTSDIETDYTIPCITGSVHGSGENGYVYGDTHVTLNKGLIGHSLYGAGKGKGTYTKSLNKITATVTTDNTPAEPVTTPTQTETTYQADIYSLIAGRVMGNTYVTMNDGHVGRNVYGGGNMGSVGKGNYAGGNDDYVHDSEIGAAQGYGEKIDGNLWTENPAANTDAWYFQNSGKTTVKVLGGTVGYINTDNPEKSMKNELPYGNVFGGSAGEAAANIADNPRDLYLYSPAFFSGYVNETDVTIGTSGQETDADAGQAGKAPRILGSVYGGGQDGHVRRDAKVTVYSGEIGLPYTSTNTETLGTNLDSPQWMHRGNIYGGGSGITKYRYDFNHDGDYLDVVSYGPDAEHMVPTKEEDYSTSSGSVTRFTEVNVLGGIIHRNVYGGGSMGSVGAPNMGQNYVPYKPGQANIDGKPANGPGRQSMNTINIGGGTTMVTIGTPFNSTRGWTYNKLYGGEVYGACRGMSELNPEEFSTSVWTKITVKNGATIMGNVYGGGDNGAVKKDTDVRIGESE